MIVAASTGTAGLIIAIVAVALSATSLAWQAATFMLSGPRIRVLLHEGFRHTTTGALFVGRLTAFKGGGRAIAELGYTQHVLVIEVQNRGRIASNVTAWTLVLADGGAVYLNLEDPLNPQLPHRLEPHSVQAWSIDAQTVVASDGALSQQFRGGPIRGEVHVGSSRVRSRNAYRVEGTLVEIVPWWRRLAPRLARRGRDPHN